MKMNVKILIKPVIIFIFIFNGIYISFSQQDNTMYFMPLVPQTHQINPANQPECNFYFGIPSVSPFQADFENGSFSLNDILWYNNDIDSTITFLHPLANKQDFLDNFGKANYISTEIFSNILSVGVRFDEKYFTLDVSARGYSKLIYPGDLIKITVDGLENGYKYDLSSFGTKTILYTEIALGGSNRFSDQLVAGIKAKFLFGAGSLITKAHELSIDTRVSDWVLTSDFEANVSMPGLIINTDENGEFSGDSVDFDDDLSISELIKDALKNKGFAIDLGVNYKPPVDGLTVSFSIIDLGFIRWKSNTYNIVQDAIFTFEGIETSIDESISDSLLNAFEDSLSNTFAIHQQNNRYTSFLNTKIYIGAKYDISENFGVGLLSRSQFVNGRIREQLTLSTNFKPSSVVGASFSWSIMNRTVNNFGAGLSFRFGLLNIYLLSDNIPLRYTPIIDKGEEVQIPIVGGVPYKAKTFNIRIGLNLVFGCNQNRRLMKDKPLFY